MWPLTPSGGPCVRFFFNEYLWRVCFGLKPSPIPSSGQSVRRAAGTGCPRNLHHTHKHTHHLVFEPRWTESPGLAASFESTSGSADRHANKTATGKKLLCVYFGRLRYLPGIQVQVEVKFYLVLFYDDKPVV